MKPYLSIACLALALSVALPAYAADSDQPRKWTKDDVSSFCHSRFQDGAAGYKHCVKDYTKRINLPISLGEAQEIDNAKASDGANH